MVANPARTARTSLVNGKDKVAPIVVAIGRKNV